MSGIVVEAGIRLLLLGALLTRGRGSTLLTKVLPWTRSVGMLRRSRRFGFLAPMVILMSNLIPSVLRNNIAQRLVATGDRFIAEMRHLLNAPRFEAHIVGYERWASFMTLLASLIGFTLGIVVAIKTENGYAALLGIIWLGAVLIAYYTGMKALPACHGTVRSSPTSISSSAILDILGLYLCIMAIGSLAYGLYASIDSSDWGFLIFAMVGFVPITYLIAVTLTPSLVSLTVDPETSAGGDVIALVLLPIKALVRLSTLIMGIALTIGVVAGIALLHSVIKNPLYYFDIKRSVGFVLLVVGGLLFPVAAYVAFIILCFISDIILAILRLHRITLR